MDEKALVSYTNPKSPISEAYRVLRTNIQFSAVDKPLKVIAVTSSIPQEGKSTTIANLAITFAQSGCKTLLIDTDLRKPAIHKLFNIFNYNGITNALVKRDNYTHYVQKCEIDNLHILTSGPVPPNPSELLSSNYMKQLLQKIREDYDIILMDSPPVDAVTDAAILSTMVDGTILVAASGKVEVEAARRAKELLQNVNANIIGVVLNKLSKNLQGSYYKYSSYYGEEDKKVKKEKNAPKKKEKENEILGW